MQLTVAHEGEACSMVVQSLRSCWAKMMQAWNQLSLLRLGQDDFVYIGDESAEMGDFLPPIDLAGRAVRQVSPGFDYTCALLEGDDVRCWGANFAGQLGIGSTAYQSGMGEALVATELFVITLGEELDGLRLVGSETSGFLQIQYNGSVGLICDDQWSDANAQVACRQLGLTGGRAVSAAQKEIVQACAGLRIQAKIGETIACM